MSARSSLPPTPPLNLVGDFGGGSLYLIMGILAALHERNASGIGQVIDAAIVDGAASMMAMFSGLSSTGAMSMRRDQNRLGGAAPFYRCYQCADDRYIAVGAVETQFYAELLRLLDLPPSESKRQRDVEQWPEITEMFAKIFRTRTRDEWAAHFIERADQR